MDDVVWLKTDPSMFKSKWSTVSFFFYLMVCFYMEKQALFTEMNTERVWHSTFTPMGFGYNY